MIVRTHRGFILGVGHGGVVVIDSSGVRIHICTDWVSFGSLGFFCLGGIAGHSHDCIGKTCMFF